MLPWSAGRVIGALGEPPGTRTTYSAAFDALTWVNSDKLLKLFCNGADPDRMYGKSGSSMTGKPGTSAAPRRFNLIANYGLSWKLSKTEWGSANQALKAHRGLVGERPGKRRANFWGQDGIYVL